MFVVASILYAIATFIRLFMARRIRLAQTQPTEKPSFAKLKVDMISIFGLLTAGGVMTWIFISDGVSDVSFSMIGNLFPLYMNNLVGISMTELGILGAIAAVASMIFMVAGGSLSDKYGERVGIVLGNIFIAGAIFMMLNVQAFGLFVVSWILFGIGQALVGPAYSSLISKVVPQKLRGTAFGLFSTSLGVISLPAPYIGVLLWENFGPKVPFYVPLVMMLLMLPVIWVKFRLPKNGQGAGSAETEKSAAVSLTEG
jgi:MFS family permease